MMYNSKLVASIKANGKVLREFKDTVYIPFGSEYSILLKNLNTARALINIYIDGDNVVPGGLVLRAGQELDLERAIRNNNLTEGNKFKFIERTGKIEDHRGIKLEDGLIRVEYQFEKVYQRQDGIQWNPYHIQQYDSHSTTILRSAEHRHPGVACSDYSYSATSASLNDISASASLNTWSDTIATSATSQTETGITVAGSKSEQKFSTVSSFTCEPEKHNIIFKLLGETAENKTIREPITVKAKPKCTTCGKQNKATAKFCSDCGTALVIYA